MPGHLLRANCPCGFDRELSPGATFDGLYVMAYTEDGKDLKTFNDESAKQRGLAVLADPCLMNEKEEERLLELDDADEFSDRMQALMEQEHGPYRCPTCGEATLFISYIGSWD